MIYEKSDLVGSIYEIFKTEILKRHVLCLEMRSISNAGFGHL